MTDGEAETAAGTWTVEIELQGMMLWMDRGGYFDVLMLDDGADGGAHHVVELRREADGSAQSLVRQFIDLSSLTQDGARSPEAVPRGFLPVRVSLDSPAADADITRRGNGLVCALTLPYGSLTPGVLEGPFDYDGRPAVMLSTYVTWTGTYPTPVSLECPAFEFTTNGPVARPPVRLGSFSSAQRRVHVTISALSPDDQQGERRLEPGDSLDEVAVIHDFTDGSLFATRQLPTLLAPTHPAAVGVPAVLDQTLDNLCPHTFGVLAAM